MKTRHKRKITYWICAVIWTILAGAWLSMALQNIYGSAVVNFICALMYLLFGFNEIRCYQRDKGNLEK